MPLADFFLRLVDASVIVGADMLAADSAFGGKAGADWAGHDFRFRPMADIPVPLFGVLRWEQSRKGEIPL